MDSEGNTTTEGKIMHENARKKLLTTMALLGAACLLPGLAQAQVRGVCSDCHTMHNSQDGAYMNVDPVTGLKTATVYGALTSGDCIGCHTNTTNTAGRNASGNIPYVNHINEPSQASGGMLAGGSFYWVKSNDKKGHNVEGIVAQDGTLFNTPPGYDAIADGKGYDTDERLTCAGTNGCHGDRNVAGNYGGLSGAHHGAQPDGQYTSGNTLANSYRFLNTIKGIESPDWESLLEPTSRNVYYGKPRAGDNTNDRDTISSLCGQCHGNFHSGASNISESNNMASPWVRHPTDFDMGQATGSEYATYEYHMEAPVGSSIINAGYARPAVADIMNTPGDAIVTCISCHRAHGSAHDDLLRWSYAGMQAHDAGGAAGTGCFRCHTSKDT
jgi:hypothetical protein